MRKRRRTKKKKAFHTMPDGTKMAGKAHPRGRKKRGRLRQRQKQVVNVHIHGRRVGKGRMAVRGNAYKDPFRSPYNMSMVEMQIGRLRADNSAAEREATWKSRQMKTTDADIAIKDRMGKQASGGGVPDPPAATPFMLGNARPARLGNAPSSAVDLTAASPAKDKTEGPGLPTRIKVEPGLKIGRTAGGIKHRSSAQMRGDRKKFFTPRPRRKGEEGVTLVSARQSPIALTPEPAQEAQGKRQFAMGIPSMSGIFG
jgi:hypothetical protein